MSTGANTFITTHPASWISPFGFQSFLLFYHETIWMQWFIGLPMLCSEETDRVCSHPALWLDSLISRQDKDGLCLNEPMWWSERSSSIHLSFIQTWLGWTDFLLKIQIIEKQCWRSINSLYFIRHLPLWLLHSKSCCRSHFSFFFFKQHISQWIKLSSADQQQIQNHWQMTWNLLYDCWKSICLCSHWEDLWATDLYLTTFCSYTVDGQNKSSLKPKLHLWAQIYLPKRLIS